MTMSQGCCPSGRIFLFWFWGMRQCEKLGNREKMHGVQYIRDSQTKRKYCNRASQPSGSNAWWPGGGADLIITETKCTINEMCLNYPETIPPSPSGEKLSSTKPVPGAKKSGQPLLQTKENGFTGAWVCDRGVLLAVLYGKGVLFPFYRALFEKNIYMGLPGTSNSFSSLKFSGPGTKISTKETLIGNKED